MSVRVNSVIFRAWQKIRFLFASVANSNHRALDFHPNLVLWPWSVLLADQFFFCAEIWHQSHTTKLPPVFRSIPFVLLGTGKYFQEKFNSNMAVTLKCGVSCQILFILLTKRKRQRMRMLGIKRSVPLLSSLDSGLLHYGDRPVLSVCDNVQVSLQKWQILWHETPILTSAFSWKPPHCGYM